MFRYRAKAPSGWDRNSDYAVDVKYRRSHERALSLFGLDAAPGTDAAIALMRSHSYRGEGAAVDVPWKIGRHRGLTIASAEDAAMVGLVSIAEAIADSTGAATDQVVGYLLTGRPFRLPWIEIVDRFGPLGPSFTIYVGSVDASADAVREAYNEAVKQYLGTDRSRAPRADSILAALMDARGRAAGLSWEQRWERWKVRAAQTGANPYLTRESYRVQVESTRKACPWITEFDQTDTDEGARG